MILSFFIVVITKWRLIYIAKVLKIIERIKELKITKVNQ